MKINSIHNTSFKGYDARPIKNLYMRRSSLCGQQELYKELYNIGQDVGFGVVMEYANGKVAKNPNELIIGYETKCLDSWAQDDKFIVCDKGKPSILYSKEYKGLNNNKYVKNFANITKMKTKPSRNFYGGNVFFGTKSDGENYLLMGENEIFEYMKESFSDVENAKKAIADFIDENPSDDETKEARKKLDEVIGEYAEDFNVRKENIFILRQPNFHLDMAIRPLKYPYVVVNDFLETDKVMKNAGMPESILNEYKEYQIRSVVSDYVTGEQTSKELERYGFVPIRIAGAYTTSVNFMNAIVHEKDDGTLCYITNSSKGENKNYEQLQDNFEKQIKEKCEGVEDVRFVTGKDISFDNNIMAILKSFSGGVHCLTLEEPRFDKVV